MSNHFIIIKVKSLAYNANLKGASSKVLFSLAFKSTVASWVGKVFLLLDGPEALDELPVDCRILDVELVLRKVFELGVLLHGLDHIGASPEENSHDVKRGLLAVNTEDAERVLAQLVIHALNETSEEVVCHVKDNTLILALLVVDEVKGEGCIIPALPESL
jgi:hypothetical protein